MLKIVAIEAVIFVIAVACTSALKGLQCWPAHRDKTKVSNFYFDLLIYSPAILVKKVGVSEFMVFTFLENALNLCVFTYAPVPHSKLQIEFFENLFPPRPKGWGKPWFGLWKLNQKIWRWLGTLVYLNFVWFVIFLNVIALLFCEWYLSNSVALSLLPLLWNLCLSFGNLALKLHQKK